MTKPEPAFELTLDVLYNTKQACKEADKDITSALIILKEMKAKYPATFRAHNLEETDALLRKARAKLK